MKRSGATHAWPAAVAFAVNGGLYGGMLSRYAEIAAGAHAEAVAFGVALTTGALGGLAGSILAPLVMRVCSEQITMVMVGLAYAVFSVALPLAPNPSVLAAAFFMIGAADGAHDVSMNALTVRYQQRLRLPLMGRLHALWSLALAAGAALGAAAAALGVAPALHLGIAAAILGTTQLLASRSTRCTGSIIDEPGAAIEPGAGNAHRFTLAGARGLLVMIVVAAIAASYIEGPGQDWSAIVLADAFAADTGTAAAAPFAFSLGLLISRLLLDPLRRRFSASRIATAAAALVAVGGLNGLLAAHLHAPAPLALATLVLIGFGAGPIYPMLFDTANTLGSRHRISPATTAGIISTCSRIGAITAPVLVGQLAHTAGLGVVLTVIATAGILSLITLPRALRP
ncbi:MFS transporter [Nesterenkonia ebinurensis]|uniref:MFS transporter n=1 Tax=Nesterenkonia ebinurensis TaxID=2608252 RepID=UPI00123D1753|nr:MFS transporter [Nesterenkonia ebinurensis]